MSEACVGSTGSIPRLGLHHGLCLQDGPAGVRNTDYISSFPAGGTIAASFDRGLMHERGRAMGAEHRGKGVTVQLGPVAGPLGRAPEGGRNWEGFSPDPVLSGVGMFETIKGIQSEGVIACAKVRAHAFKTRARKASPRKVLARDLLTLYSTSSATSKSTSVKLQRQSATATTSQSLCLPTWTTVHSMSSTHGHLLTLFAPVSDPSCVPTTSSTILTAARIQSS